MVEAGHLLLGVLSIVGSIVVSTWMLRSQLSNIEVNVGKQDVRIETIDARVVRLEDARRAR